MAEGQMMTPADVVARAMAGEHGDLLRESVALVVRELMEAEVAQLTGAGRGERSAERVTHRNGYRPSSTSTCSSSAAGRLRAPIRISGWTPSI